MCVLGIEVVASMCKTAASVTCVARREPFVGVFGEEVAVALKKVFYVGNNSL